VPPSRSASNSTAAKPYDGFSTTEGLAVLLEAQHECLVVEAGGEEADPGRVIAVR
jgi:hypothetical protein